MGNPFEHAYKVFATAEDELHKFLEGTLEKRALTYGSASRNREGQKRQITFLQIGEPTSNIELRIEVYTVERGTKDSAAAPEQEEFIMPEAKEAERESEG